MALLESIITRVAGGGSRVVLCQGGSSGFQSPLFRFDVPELAVSAVDRDFDLFFSMRLLRQTLDSRDTPMEFCKLNAEEAESRYLNTSFRVGFLCIDVSHHFRAFGCFGWVHLVEIGMCHVREELLRITGRKGCLCKTRTIRCGSVRSLASFHVAFDDHALRMGTNRESHGLSINLLFPTSTAKVFLSLIGEVDPVALHANNMRQATDTEPGPTTVLLVAHCIWCRTTVDTEAKGSLNSFRYRTADDRVVNGGLDSVPRQVAALHLVRELIRWSKPTAKSAGQGAVNPFANVTF